MSFRKWMEGEVWKGMDLDKDLLAPGNKVYGPELCVFITPELNKFTTDHASARGDWPIGVKLHKESGKFEARCNNPFSSTREYLGLFSKPEEAHEAWRSRKHELALIYASMQHDPRVAKALSSRYLPDQEIHHD